MVFEATRADPVGALRSAIPRSLSPGARRIEIQSLTLRERRGELGQPGVTRSMELATRLATLRRLQAQGFTPGTPVGVTPQEFRAKQIAKAASADIIGTTAMQKLKAAGIPEAIRRLGLTALSPEMRRAAKEARVSPEQLSGFERLQTVEGVQRARLRTGVLLGKQPARPSIYTPVAEYRIPVIRPVTFKPSVQLKKELLKKRLKETPVIELLTSKKLRTQIKKMLAQPSILGTAEVRTLKVKGLEIPDIPTLKGAPPGPLTKLSTLLSIIPIDSPGKVLFPKTGILAEMGLKEARVEIPTVTSLLKLKEEKEVIEFGKEISEFSKQRQAEIRSELMKTPGSVLDFEKFKEEEGFKDKGIGLLPLRVQYQLARATEYLPGGKEALRKLNPELFKTTLNPEEAFEKGPQAFFDKKYGPKIQSGELTGEEALNLSLTDKGYLKSVEDYENKINKERPALWSTGLSILGLKAIDFVAPETVADDIKIAGTVGAITLTPALLAKIPLAAQSVLGAGIAATELPVYFRPGASPEDRVKGAIFGSLGAVSSVRTGQQTRPGQWVSVKAKDLLSKSTGGLIGNKEVPISFVRLPTKVSANFDKKGGDSWLTQRGWYGRQRGSVLVTDNKGNVLLVKDKDSGKFLLPGGGIKHDKPKLGTLKELEEELGLTGRKISNKLEFIKKEAHEETHYIYKLKLSPEEVSKLKAGSDVELLKWVNPKNVPEPKVSATNPFGKNYRKDTSTLVNKYLNQLPKINKRLSGLSKLEKRELLFKSEKWMDKVYGKPVTKQYSDTEKIQEFLLSKEGLHGTLYPTLGDVTGYEHVGNKVVFKANGKEANPIFVGRMSRYDVPKESMAVYAETEAGLITGSQQVPRPDPKISGFRDKSFKVIMNVRGEPGLYFQPPLWPGGPDYLGASYLGIGKNAEAAQVTFRIPKRGILKAKEELESYRILGLEEANKLGFTRRGFTGSESEVIARPESVFKFLTKKGVSPGEAREATLLSGVEVQIQRVQLQRPTVVTDVFIAPSPLKPVAPRVSGVSEVTPRKAFVDPLGLMAITGEAIREPKVSFEPSLVKPKPSAKIIRKIPIGIGIVPSISKKIEKERPTPRRIFPSPLTPSRKAPKPSAPSPFFETPTPSLKVPRPSGPTRRVEIKERPTPRRIRPEVPFRPPRVGEPPFKPKRTITPPPPISLRKKLEEKKRKLKKKKKVEEYQAFVKRKGRFVAVGKATSRARALRKGADVTIKTAAATFQVRKTGKKIRAIKNGVAAPSKKTFRTYTVKSGKRVALNKDTFIQRRKKRIATPGELAEITRKGQAKRKASTPKPKPLMKTKKTKRGKLI